MSFGTLRNSNNNQPMADINTTPLVDVMLVLLVIFIITAPLFHQAVTVDLPRVDGSQFHEKTQVLKVSIDAKNKVFVDGEEIIDADLGKRFELVMSGEKIIEMHLWADRHTRYERVTEVMAKAQKTGIKKIAFVTEKAN
jgi:biopolymer transport protein ExbD